MRNEHDKSQLPKDNSAHSESKEYTVRSPATPFGTVDRSENSALVHNQALSSEVRVEYPKRGVFKELIQSMTSEIVLFTIAFGLVIGSILFYFQGLQPLLLRNYATQTRSQLLELQRTFVGQAESAIVVKEALIQANTYSPGETCSTSRRYDSFARDVDQINRLSTTLLDREEFAQVRPQFGVVSVEITSIYTRTYDSYKTQLSAVRAQAELLRGMPQYYEYINAWIEACVAIDDSAGLIVDIQNACESLRNARAIFDEGIQPTFWSELEKSHVQALEPCEEIESLSGQRFYSEFPQWQLRWLDGYSEVRSFTPLLGSFEVTIQQSVNVFIESVNIAETQIQAVLRDRNIFWNQWYFLTFTNE